ncbi:hypothetical protein [Paenibacillus albus]|uniref:Uncharacterized protein n=1 Tax=Paenibacillus albus TaxID=2495582 RepID=A0A3Q8X1K2_9BACL|nr:hypothetical protein [Paenibacillus albus]AZN38279.1 hypothetical protein EJC50_00255 [Paenibacillus albus]
MWMKSRKRTLLLGACLFTAILIAGLLLANGERFTAHAPAKQTSLESEPAASKEIETSDTSAISEAPAVAQTTPVVHAFRTDSATEQVLWQDGKRVVFAQNGQLIYSSAAESAAEQTLYTWKTPLSSQAWLNGEYLLIGTQLIGGEGSGERGSWFVIRISDNPIVLVDQKSFFGPDDILSIGMAEKPRLFFVQWRNAEAVDEYVLDPSYKGWERVEGGGIDLASGARSRTAAVPYQLAEPKVIQLGDESTVYAFSEESGTIVYYTKPYFMVRRYDGYDLTDAKLMPFLDGRTTQVIGLLKDGSGKEWMSFLNYDPRLLQLDGRIWSEEWQALNEWTFTHASADQLEVLQYEEGNGASAHPPSYRQFKTDGAKLVSAQQSLLTYEAAGKKQLIEWRDLINTAGAPKDRVWASPLQDSIDFEVKQEPRPPWDAELTSHKIVAHKLEERNANAPVPDDLLEALDEVNRDGDYGASKTFRKFGSDWYVLVDRQFYAYQDGQMNLLGEMPITLTVEIGEAAGAVGASDYIRLDDGWLVADTEASRVVKLNDRLQVVAELEVSHPYRLELRGSKLQVTSYAQTMVTDTSLKQSRVVSQSFQAAAKKELEEHEFWPEEWFRDSKSGLTWYYLNGFLYQYKEQSKRYRSFYLGVNENARAHVHIISYKGEVNVLLDHRLERFDRQGRWIGSLPIPRGNPDGIYDTTPQGESSLVMDEASGSLYLVQGYRIMRIDLNEHTAEMVFRQDYSDISKLSLYKGVLYLVLHSNQQDFYSRLQEGDTAMTNMNTEIVAIDLAQHDVKRYSVEGYYDAVRVGSGAESALHMDLIQYQANN